MGIFSKTHDYNIILEQVLDNKKYSPNVKSLLLSMLYKIDYSYNDYKTVKRIEKTKDEFLANIINIISDNINDFNIVEMSSEEGEKLKKSKIISVVDSNEGSITTFPIEAAFLYSIAEIEPKYYFIKNFLFKKELKKILVEGYKQNALEVLDDFNGWSWNTKNTIENGIEENLIYQNMQLLFGDRQLEFSKDSFNNEFDIVEKLKNEFPKYYNSLVEYIFCRIKNEILVKNLNMKIKENAKLIEQANDQDGLNKKISVIESKNHKIKIILKDEEKLKKALEIKNKKLDSKMKIKNIAEYKESLNLEMKKNLGILNKLYKLKDEDYIKYLNEEYLACQNLSKLDISADEALKNLQKSFIESFEEKIKQIKTRENFIDIIFKLRYYRNVNLTKTKFIKDDIDLEKLVNKLYKKVLTLGTKNAVIKMLSMNIALNAKLLIMILDSNIVDLTQIKIRLVEENNIIKVEVFENDSFEKNFKLVHKLENTEIVIKKNRRVKLFV